MFDNTPKATCFTVFAKDSILILTTFFNITEQYKTNVDITRTQKKQ